MASRVIHNRKPRGRALLWMALLAVITLVVLASLALYLTGAVGGGGLGIKVESEPSGASVLVNGHVAGATPVTIKGLSNGSYDVRLEKAEYAPVSLRVEVSGSAAKRIHEKLKPVARGALIVNIKPAGSEVLVDGELAGHTPLQITGIEAGPHELMVRKTNFSTYSHRVQITPGETSKFEDIELADRILELMEGKVKTEPQRVGHYIDLGHYYFVNDRMDDAVETFVLGQEAISTPLDFDGPGFPGKAKMLPEEIELETRLRREDAARFPKELDKHRTFPGKDVKLFRMKLMEAFDNNNRKDVKSWAHTKLAAQEKVAARNYDEAAKIYKAHIAAAPKSVELPTAYLALIETLCMQGDVDGVADQFNTFYTLYDKKDGQSLRAAGKILNDYVARQKRKTDQDRLLKMAEKTLRAGLAMQCEDEAKSDSLFELGMSIFEQDRVAQSIPVLKLSIDSTRALSKQEDRQLRLAEALRKSGDRAGALALYDKLKASERPNVRESANYGLIVIKQSEPKQ